MLWFIVTMPADVSMKVYPSGAARAVCSAARMPPAPGLLSTTTGCPRFLDMVCAIVRARKSVLAPAANGAIRRIGRVGGGKEGVGGAGGKGGNQANRRVGEVLGLCGTARRQQHDGCQPLAPDPDGLVRHAGLLRFAMPASVGHAASGMRREWSKNSPYVDIDDNMKMLLSYIHKCP